MLRRVAVSAALALAAAPAHADTRLGVMADVGAPDGANLSLVLHPVGPLRLEAGGGHNAVSPCVRGGVALVPFARSVTPTLSVDVGRCFEGDANPLARRVMGDPAYSSRVLDRVGYDYATARVGLELGGAHVRFFLDAGATRVRGGVHGASTTADEMSGATVTFTSDPAVTLTTVSARLGLIVYVK